MFWNKKYFRSKITQIDIDSFWKGIFLKNDGKLKYNEIGTKKKIFTIIEFLRDTNQANLEKSSKKLNGESNDKILLAEIKLSSQVVS